MPTSFPSRKRKLSLSNSKRPAQRRRPQPSRQTNANSAPAVVQRSADDPQPICQTTFFSRWMHQSWKGMLSGSASAGGELILGRRKSALFFKSSLSERRQAASSDFWKTHLADSRRPRSQPPTKPQTRQHPLPRRPPIRTKKETPPFQCLPSGIVYSFLIYISVNNFSLSGSSPLNNSRNKIITGSYP